MCVCSCTAAPCAVSVCSPAWIQWRGMFYIKCTSSQVHFLPSLSFSETQHPPFQPGGSSGCPQQGLDMERGVQGAASVGELGTPGLGCLADEVTFFPPTPLQMKGQGD